MAQGEEDELWLTLAELFFLDTESLESDFARAAELLKKNGWSRSRTEKTLVQLIAPQVASNIGWGLYPVNGEWAGFDGKVLSEKVRRSITLRAARPDWHFTLLDWWYRRLLNQLGMQRLLNRLDAPPASFE